MIQEVVNPVQSGSSSTWFLVELEFGSVGFWGEGKTGVPGEKPLGATNSTHIWRRRRDLNPHHIGHHIWIKTAVYQMEVDVKTSRNMAYSQFHAWLAPRGFLKFPLESCKNSMARPANSCTKASIEPRPHGQGKLRQKVSFPKRS